MITQNDTELRQVGNNIRIGVSGTGFIALNFFRLVKNIPNYSVSHLLSRRKARDFSKRDYASLVTNNIFELIEGCDIILECSGDAIWASEVIKLAFQVGRPVVTMNSEFQIIAGSYYRQFGTLHESAGDQPGSLAVLDHEVRMMGFEPLVYGSQKSFLNPSPDLESMQYWAKRNNQSLEKTISFSDGTKVQIEAALTANGLNADILQEGLMGPTHPSTQTGAIELANIAISQNKVITDYVLHDRGFGEVFIVAKHSVEQHAALSYYKFGQGPFYFIEKPFHLGHFEILKSIDVALTRASPLFNNGAKPTISVAAVAKCSIAAGTLLKQCVGSFKTRGVAVHIKDHPTHIPIGLIRNCEVQRGISAGEILTFEDIALPETLASKAWQFTRAQYPQQPQNVGLA